MYNMLLSNEEAIAIQTGQTRPCSAPAAITISRSHNHCRRYVSSSSRKTAFDSDRSCNSKGELLRKTAVTNDNITTSSTSLHANSRSDRNPRLPRQGAATICERLANIKVCSVASDDNNDTKEEQKGNSSNGSVVGINVRYPFFAFSVDQRLPLFTSVVPRAVVSPSKKAVVVVAGQQQQERQGRGGDAFTHMGSGQLQTSNSRRLTTSNAFNSAHNNNTTTDDHPPNNNKYYEEVYTVLNTHSQTAITGTSCIKDSSGLEKEKAKEKEEGKERSLPISIGRLGQKAKGQDWNLQRRSKNGRGFFGGGLVGKMLALKERGSAKCANEEHAGEEGNNSDYVSSCNTTPDASDDDDNKSDDTIGIITSLTADEIAKEQARTKALQTILLAKRIEEDNEKKKHNPCCHSFYSSSHHLTCPPLTSPPKSSSCCGTDSNNNRRATTTPIGQLNSHCIMGSNHRRRATTDEKLNSGLERRNTAGRNSSSSSSSASTASGSLDESNGHHHPKPIKSGLLFSLTRKYDKSYTSAANTNINKDNTALDSTVVPTDSTGPNTTADRRTSRGCTIVKKVEALQRVGRRYLSVSQHVRLVSMLHIIDCCLELSHVGCYDGTIATAAPEEAQRMLQRGQSRSASSSARNSNSTRTLILISKEYEDALHIENLANAYALEEEEQRHACSASSTSTSTRARAGANDGDVYMDDTDEEIHVLDANECRRTKIKTAFRCDEGGVSTRPLRHCVLHKDAVLKLIADVLLSGSSSTTYSRTDANPHHDGVDFRVENNDASPAKEEGGYKEECSSSAESLLVDYLSLGMMESYRNKEAVRLYRHYIHYRMLHKVTTERSRVESEAAAAAGSHSPSQYMLPTGPTEDSVPLLSFLQGLKEEICPLGAKGTEKDKATENWVKMGEKGISTTGSPQEDRGFHGRAGDEGLSSVSTVRVSKATRPSPEVPSSSQPIMIPTMTTIGTNTNTNNYHTNGLFQSNNRTNNISNNNTNVSSSMNIFEERRLRKRLTRCEEVDSDEEGDIRALQRELGIRIDDEGVEDEDEDSDGEDDKRSIGQIAPESRSQRLKGGDHNEGNVDGNNTGGSNHHHGATKAGGGEGGARVVPPSFPSSTMVVSSLSSSSSLLEVSTASDHHPNSKDTPNNNTNEKMMRLPFQRKRRHQTAQSSLTPSRRTEKKTSMTMASTAGLDDRDAEPHHHHHHEQEGMFRSNKGNATSANNNSKSNNGYHSSGGGSLSDTSRWVSFSAARAATTSSLSSSFLFSSSPSPSSLSSCGRECAICELDGYNVIPCECCGRWFHADCGVLAMRIFSSSGSDNDEAEAEEEENATRADKRGVPCRPSCETRHTLCSRWCADNYLESKKKQKVKK